MSCERLGSLGRDVKTLFGAAFGRSNYANLCRRSEHIYGLDGTQDQGLFSFLKQALNRGY